MCIFHSLLTLCVACPAAGDRSRAFLRALSAHANPSACKNVYPTRIRATALGEGGAAPDFAAPGSASAPAVRIRFAAEELALALAVRFPPFGGTALPNASTAA
jgi:hypothetical protein